MNINYLVNDLIQVYALAKLPLPEPRAIALRLLEENVELALACGASPADVHTSVHNAVHNEHLKDPSKGFHDGHVADQSEITGELADTALLQAFVQRLAAVENHELLDAAGAKIVRLLNAQNAGTLRWTADGRFYRNKTPFSTVEDAPGPSGPVNGVDPMNKGTYQGQTVQIVRAAKQGDQGYNASIGEQVVIKGDDGKEKTVAKKDVTAEQSA
jgi:hypothetical protein